MALRWHLIVVDDRNYFALRVWRYVSRTVGIQMEESTGLSMGAPAGVWPQDGDHVQSDDGEVCFWWVEATGDCIGRLEEFLAKTSSNAGVYVLVDVKGKNGSSYSARNLCVALKKIKKSRGGGDHLFHWEVVSSYPSIESIEGKPVRRKSLDTLRMVRRAIYGGEPDQRAAPRTEPKASHILVTGAGFEIAEARGGFGMPSTREILKNMGPPFRLVTKGSARKNAPGEFWIDLREYKSGFPVPDGFAWEGQLGNALRKRARRGELDLYWDIIFEESLQRRLGAVAAEVKLGIRDQEKAIALHRERRMREAFRKSLLDHDWGYMNQCLVAAGRGWHAWLTTNYTKFADRAISLRGDLNLDGRLRKKSVPWRIIATASEANMSVREDTGNTTGIGGRGRPGQDYRYLFKLHGDIAHLHTMAIAGHDKDLVNPLCVPVESLYQIYAAADRFLRNSLWNMGVEQVIWHIVGHGLQDIRLLRLIQSVCSYSGPDVRHAFILVNPLVEGPEKALNRLFKKGPKPVDPDRIKIVRTRLFASRYMARLERRGLAWFDDPNWCEGFAGEFEPEEDMGKMPGPPEPPPILRLVRSAMA